MQAMREVRESQWRREIRSLDPERNDRRVVLKLGGIVDLRLASQ
jgi:hypothetical protein